jgi:hypothetical protein
MVPPHTGLGTAKRTHETMAETPFSIHGKGIIKISDSRMNQARTEMKNVMVASKCLLPRRKLQEVQTPTLDQIKLLEKRGRVGLLVPNSSTIRNTKNNFVPPRKKSRKIHRRSNNSIGNGTGKALEHHASIRRLINNNDNSKCIDDNDYNDKSTNSITLATLQRREPIEKSIDTNSIDISPQNAKSYIFNVVSNTNVNKNQFIGWSAMRDILLQSLIPAPSPTLMTTDWVANHYKWIVWKCASMARKFPSQCGGIDGWFTPQRVLKQLEHRWRREHDNGERSCLKKM